MPSNLPALTGSPTTLVASNDIRGIKPPLEIINPWAWVWWVLALVVIAGVAVIVWRRWQRQRLQPPPVLRVSPHVRARERLHRALALLHDPRQFCIDVSGALRLYLEERFDFHAPERTTEEFLEELKATDLLLPDQKQSLGDFLQRCDLVKFGRHEPPETDLRQLHDSALRLVDETQFDKIDTTPLAPTAVTP